MSQTEFAIRAENIGKRYNLGETVSARRIFRQLGHSLRNSLSDFSNGTISPSSAVDEVERLWAVEDVSFVLGQGEVLGLIGPNGAGKSTLLKLLCQITEPTTGRIEIQGRVGALLEVGAGFKPMLSGLENLYLQGAWLGMSKREIQSKIDEIIEFSSLQEFLDTPVKRYSSGMRLRLAFSVAAHLSPEIIIIDEALAVGDVGFRQKCITKLTSIAQSGRTVIFVSHNPELIMSLCSRVLWLDSGHIIRDGEPNEVMRAYAESGLQASASSSDLKRRHDRRGDRKLLITRIECQDEHRQSLTPAVVGKPLCVVIRFELQDKELHDLTVNLTLRNSDGLPVLFLSNTQTDTQLVDIPSSGEARCHIDRVSLIPGSYLIDVEAVLPSGRADFLRDAHRLEVAAGAFYNNSMPLESHGVFYSDQNWTLEDV